MKTRAASVRSCSHCGAGAGARDAIVSRVLPIRTDCRPKLPSAMTVQERLTVPLLPAYPMP